MNDSHVTVLADGRDLGWLEVGDPAGSPVLAFHGTPGSRLQLALDDLPLRASGVRLVCLDRPGYGLSTFQVGRRLVDWPADVAQLADHLGIDSFAVMGVSGGGPHAAACAALLADRVSAAGIVSGVGPLTDPAATDGMMWTNKAFTAVSRRGPWALRPIFGAQVAASRRWPAKSLEMLSKQLPAADAAILRRPDVQAHFERDASRSSRTTARAIVQDFELFSTDWGFDLGAITVPVHLWQGDADKTVPPHHATIQHEAIPGSELHWFEGEGHFFAIDRGEEIARVLIGR